MDLARQATSAPSASKASDVNYDFVDMIKKEEEDGDLQKLAEYKVFLENAQ